MDLQSLQRAFQSRVLSGDQAVEAQLCESDAADLPARIDAYAGGYRSRLVEALGTSYPVLKALLGEEEFESSMRRYIQATPSRHYSIRYYGAHVAEFIASSAVANRDEVVAEVARWEWMLAEVFDASDDDPVDADRLVRVQPQEWEHVGFRFRSSLRVVVTATNAVQWWRAIQGERAAPSAYELEPPTHWVMWRRGLKTMFRSVDHVEAAALTAACGGLGFGVICESVAGEVDAGEAPLRAASLLRGWFADELIADLDVREPL